MGAGRLLPAQVAGGRRLSRLAAEPGRSRAIPGRAEGGAAPGPGGGAALRRLPLHRARGGRAHPRHERDHRAAHRLRHRSRGLGAHRGGPRAHPLGRRDPPRRPHPDRLLLQPLPRLVGRARRRRAPRGHRVPVRRGRAGPDTPGRAVGPRSPALGFLRHPVLRAALRGNGAPGVHRPREPGPPHPLLLGRARRGHPGHPRPHRADLRRPMRGHGQHGRDDPVDDQRRVPPPHRHASLAGSRLHPGLRSGDVPAAALRRRGHARVHSPRADLAAHDPARPAIARGG